MAGLLIKELIVRGDLQRCLVVCPGSLAEQWQDELYRRFQLPFEILTNDKLEAAHTGNWFLETNLVIARLDKLSRNEDLQSKLQAPDCFWDLVVYDEAHKLSATARYEGGLLQLGLKYPARAVITGCPIDDASHNVEMRTTDLAWVRLIGTPRTVKVVGVHEGQELHSNLCWVDHEHDLRATARIRSLAGTIRNRVTSGHWHMGAWAEVME